MCRFGAPLALALVAAASFGARADFAFASFSVEDAPDAALSLVGVANRTGDRLRLTPPQSGTAGGLWCALRAERARALRLSARAVRSWGVAAC